MKWYAKLYTRLVFIFLYLPIIVAHCVQLQ